MMYQMLRLYYASAIDTCVEDAFKQIDKFKALFDKYTKKESMQVTYGFDPKWVRKEGVNNPIEVYGAGFGESPIIGPDSSYVFKGAVSAYDLRQIRQCDILLVVTDLKQFAAGTFQELEYARNLGIFTILFVHDTKLEGECMEHSSKVKNIFLETYVNKIIYSMEELEVILKDLTK